MTNLLAEIVWGSENFGYGYDRGRPAVFIFTLPVYVYALCIVTGMCLAILVAALYFKKRGYDPYDVTIYALVLIPFGVLGARAYVYIFPWEGRTMDWSTYFTEIRYGGLGIYGGVIMGYVAAFVLTKIKKHDFRIITDSVLPGVLIAQSIGRWGNFANQEAYGNLITHEYGNLLHGSSALFSRFNGYAVWIGTLGDNPSGGWYQATFFYESVCTMLGFLICVLILTRSKHYKLGWCTAFYGIYYGIVRLVIESLRTDSLYLWIGSTQTDIKISQLVSVFTIILGLWTLSKIYRKQLHGLYKKLFKSDLDEMSKSRWILLALSILLFGGGVTLFVFSARAEFGQSLFIAGFCLTALAVYSALGVWSIHDRMKLYCKVCSECHAPVDTWQTERQKHYVAVICYLAVAVLLAAFGLFSLIKWGILDGIPNGTVLMVVCYAVAIAIVIWKFLPEYKALKNSPADTRRMTMIPYDCGETKAVKYVELNKFLLFVFPPKVYVDYGVEHLKPWVDPDKGKKRKNKKATVDGSDAPSDKE
ncbi:MAG: prolipoprotein diacylglyceryl transferase [Clostridiales bacterium]|nr:prolipoprotein diacylglyceryl transferase [Clostridiales bacterium]